MSFYTPHWNPHFSRRQDHDEDTIWFYFAESEKATPSEWEYLTEQRLKVFENLLQQDMLVRLASPSGDIPWGTKSSDYSKLTDMADQLGMKHGELCRHLQHLEYSGVASLYNGKKLKESFFPESHTYPFATIEVSFRHEFIKYPKAEILKFVRDLLLQRKIFKFTLGNPCWEIDMNGKPV